MPIRESISTRLAYNYKKIKNLKKKMKFSLKITQKLRVEDIKILSDSLKNEMFFHLAWIDFEWGLSLAKLDMKTD